MENNDIQKSVTYSLSLMMFWIKGSMSVDKRYLKISSKNLIFGFIPFGSDNKTVPVDKITGVKLVHKADVKPMILGVLLFGIGYFFLGKIFIIAALFLLIGMFIFSSGFQNGIEFEKAGDKDIIYVPFYEKDKIYSIIGAIEDSMSHNRDKVDLDIFSKKLFDKLK